MYKFFVVNSSCYIFVESKSHVKAKCVAIDFTQGPAIYAKVKSALTGLDIGVLGMISDTFSKSLELCMLQSEPSTTKHEPVVLNLNRM